MLLAALKRNTGFSSRPGRQLVVKACSTSPSADHLGTCNRGGKDVKPFSAIPGPRGLPILGNLKDLSANISQLHLYLYRCFKEYGDIFKFKIMQSK